MRIGLLTTSFPRTPDDIAGNFVLGFARALAQRGHELDVLAPEPAEPMSVHDTPNISLHHVPYLRPRKLQRTFYGAGVPDNVQHDRTALLGALSYPIALAARSALLAPRWNAVISHWALPSAVCAGIAARGLPHLAVLHSADVHLLGRLPLRTHLARHMTDHASTLWFVSEQHREQFVQLLPASHTSAARARAFVSPMGIDPPQVTPSSRTQGRATWGLQRFSVLALGRLVPVKGLDTAIEAVAQLDATLLVAGEGPERARLEQLGRARRADVRWLGNVTGPRKTELLAAADAFVLPSRVLPSGRSEGMPHALLEAMAHGLPVVATRVGGVSELLRDGTSALLVPPDDPALLRAALMRLQSDPPLREQIRQQARACTEGLLWPNLAPRIEGLLHT